MPIQTVLRIYRNESDDTLSAKLSEAYDEKSPLYKDKDAQLRLIDEWFHRGYTLEQLERLVHPSLERRKSQ